MLYNHQPAPPQLRTRCRNPKCGARLELPVANRRDAFCSRSCEVAFYGCRCRVCEALLSKKTKRRQVCARSHCRHELQRHFEQFFGTRYPPSGVGHKRTRKPNKINTKNRCQIGSSLPHCGRSAGPPDQPSIPSELPVPETNRAFLEHRRRKAREALFQRDTQPLNVIGVGAFKFSSAPNVDLNPASATPSAPARPPIGDDIPAFLRQTTTAPAGRR